MFAIVSSLHARLSISSCVASMDALNFSRTSLFLYSSASSRSTFFNSRSVAVDVSEEATGVSASPTLKAGSKLYDGPLY